MWSKLADLLQSANWRSIASNNLKLQQNGHQEETSGEEANVNWRQQRAVTEHKLGIKSECDTSLVLICYSPFNRFFFFIADALLFSPNYITIQCSFMVVTILCMLAYSRDTSVGLSDDKFTVAFFFKFKHSLNSWSSQLKSISFGSFFSVPTW